MCLSPGCGSDGGPYGGHFHGIASSHTNSYASTESNTHANADTARPIGMFCGRHRRNGMCAGCRPDYRNSSAGDGGGKVFRCADHGNANLR
jgi:hypothetical protein